MSKRVTERGGSAVASGFWASILLDALSYGTAGGAPQPAEEATDTGAGPDVGPIPEPVTEPADALAGAIIRAFSAGRGYLGNRYICETESVLRQWLTEDGVNYDESDLPAAMTRLETATLPGSTSRLLRGYALHRSYPITAKPLPSRAMQLMDLHPMDTREYEPADIDPHFPRW